MPNFNQPAKAGSPGAGVSAKKVEELLLDILIELRALSAMLSEGLNLRDTPEAYRADQASLMLGIEN